MWAWQGVQDMWYGPFRMDAALTDYLSSTFDTMLPALQSSLNPIHRLVTAFAYVAGMAFLVKAMFKLKRMADYRNMMSAGAEIGKVLLFAVVGAALVWTPYVLRSFTKTIFGTDSPLGYTSSASSTDFMDAFNNFMKVLGIVSFVRGWFLMAKGSQHGQNTFGKAITYIVGGLMAYHYEATRTILYNSTGLSAFSGS